MPRWRPSGITIPSTSSICATPATRVSQETKEVQIIFNDGFAPRQLTSDTDIGAAAAAGEITLIPTNEVYRCAVIGPSK